MSRRCSMLLDVTLMLLGLLAISCTPVTPNLIGPLREVTVITSRWDKVDSTLVHIVQQPVPTPQPEPEFGLRVGDPAKFETFSKFRILLLIGLPGDSLIRQVLGAAADTLVPARYNLLKVPNPWVQGQFALIFLARDTSQLVPGLVAYAGRLRATLREIALGQLARAAYVEGVDKGKSEELSRDLAFTFDVPRRWIVDRDYVGAGFLSVFVHFPDRGVFIYWSDTTRTLASEKLAGLRDSLTGRYYSGDSIDTQFTSVDTIEFLSRPCVRLSGVWMNEREGIGGPFVNYSFNYQDRFYMLDGYVYNPGKKKLSDLIQVEAVIRTFTPR
jgi:Domain of unknown function (DUF4837)